MVLLRGLNYDYSGEISAKFTQTVFKSNTSIQISSTVGLLQDDFLVIAPKTIYAEIVKINALVNDNSKLTITPLKFNHNPEDLIYKLPYNQIKFYQCATSTGTYTAVTNGLLDMNYIDNFTNFSYPLGSSIYYYKRAFYNSFTSVESNLGDFWTTSDEELYVTEQEMRSFLQFETDDYPNAADIRFFIKTSMRRLYLDVASSDENVLFISTLLLTKFYILRSLATRAIAKGYIQVTAEGRNITKAYQEFVLEAENVYQEYKEFILNNGRREVTSTNYMTDTTIISKWTRQEIIDILNGTTNAQHAQYGYKYSYFWGRSGG